MAGTTLEEFLQSNLQDFKHIDIVNMTTKQYSGYLDGDKSYNEFLTALKTIGYSFSTRNSSTPMRNHDLGGRVFFSYNNKNTKLRIPFCGYPFQLVKSSFLPCSLGKQQHTPNASKDYLDDSISGKKRRNAIVPSKKIGCMAHLLVKCIRLYNEPKYKADVNLKGATHVALKQLKEDLLKTPQPNYTLRHFILLSPAEDHNHSIESTDLKQIIHPKLVEEIQRLTQNGFSNLKEIQILLKEYVLQMFQDSKLPLPNVTNRCYYPTTKTIFSHVYKAISKLKLSSVDVTNVELLIKEWLTESPDDLFFFRHQCDEVSEQEADGRLLFCHQTQWQRDLLHKDGNELTVLVAVHKTTTKVNLPLYFMYVKTKAGYCVVGTFVIQSESCELISEALSMFCSWNPDWLPKYCMADLTEDEFSAIKQLFPECKVYVSSYHREKSWYQWLTKSKYQPPGADKTLRALWHAIAISNTNEKYINNLDVLYNSLHYADENVQQYWNDVWLPNVHLWVEAFYEEDLRSILNSNNNRVTQNIIEFCHQQVQHCTEKTLTGLLRVIINECLPDCRKAQTDPKYKLGKSPETRVRKKRQCDVLSSTVEPLIEAKTEVVEELYVTEEVELDGDQYILEIETNNIGEFVTIDAEKIPTVSEEAEVHSDLSNVYTQICEKLQSISDLSHTAYLNGQSEHLLKCLTSLIDLEKNVISDSQNESKSPEKRVLIQTTVDSPKRMKK